MPKVSLSEWNDFISHHTEAHILQTGAWGTLKSEFGWDVARLIHNGIGVQILFRKIPLGFTVAYVARPFIERQHWTNNDNFLEEIDSICRQHNAIFLKLELDEWDTNQPINLSGEWTISPHFIQPPNTIIIDLRGNENEILARMHKNCRYKIRLAQKKEVVVRKWNDISAFHKVMNTTGERNGFEIRTLDYYRRAYDLFHPSGMCEIFLSEYKNKPLATMMMLKWGNRCWYPYGGASNEERNRMPAYLLQWEAMRWAKSQGCDEYDMWGVPNENEETLEAQFQSRKDGLWGVYGFKRGFGGKVMRSVQSYDRVYNKVLYQLYKWRMKR